MYNFYSTVKGNPAYRQLSCGEALVSIFTCPLDSKFADLWSHHNYVLYVMEGRKVWHTPHGSYDLQKGSCVFVRKGASIVEQFNETEFCFVLFFLPDAFICDVLKSKPGEKIRPAGKLDPVIPIHNSTAAEAYFLSLMPYFRPSYQPDPLLLELKFRELVLLIAENPANEQLLSWFCSLMNEPQIVLQRVMEDNFCFNLKLEDYARLSARSLSAFKRDFVSLFNTTPGKWLMDKRLYHARHLLTSQAKTVAEAAFESGFENPSHFSRVFKQKFGSSPVNVRDVQVI
ncbi:helix-turn-helix domain-containing protein [Pseudobacter ginsenosidimutans]|uniref:AraC family transcriptional regulator n=1 Tax=Pseudobacter ginsenosidimutans TaxID=661488 RepID=A0A4Q7MX03_9BACT|nr:AraC family transcriptional regulator [Pseudobacter ginsenosidimutans]QEC41505.1 helix-turn-helix transcriptional regulator [Pseudobacter ginsenosidimutans]RZS71713.1 AraC family transcriptional regulator [Pseudobacter ginsenosidimutans]